MMKVPKNIVPGFFTVGNMFCGFYSVIAAFQGKIELAAWMIFAGAFLDAVDGKIARFTRTSSQFGVEYDSLADVISFGLAPSFLIYTIFGQSMRIPGILISFLPLLFGSIRLARFNTRLKGFNKEFFSGLPIPISALTLASFIIFSSYFFDNAIKYPRLLIILILLVSTLMISNIRYDVAPDLNFKGSRRDKIKVVMVIIGFIILIIFPQEALFPIMMLYILFGLFSWLFRLNKDQNTSDNEVVSESED